MASGLLALLDDIATIADDVAILTAAAAKKTSGIVTDDMAVTAEQAVGIRREREIPMILSVARGSMINKAVYLTPGALILNAVAPWSITPLLMFGGAFLCFEGVEKLIHKADAKAAAEPITDVEAYERGRISGAIRTDLILSAEIIAISLGEVAQAPLTTQIVTLYVISVVMTVGVYGLVAVLVKLDDFGELLVRRGSVGVGNLIVKGTPMLLHAISWVGMIAMLLVGGQIIGHGIPQVADALKYAKPYGALATMAAEIGLGAVVGAVLVGVYTAVKKARGA